MSALLVRCVSIGVATALGVVGSAGLALSDPGQTVATADEESGQPAAPMSAIQPLGSGDAQGAALVQQEAVPGRAAPLMTDPIWWHQIGLMDSEPISGDFDGDGELDQVVRGTDRSQADRGIMTCWAEFTLTSLNGQAKRVSSDISFPQLPAEKVYQTGWCPREYVVTDFNGDSQHELYSYGGNRASDSFEVVFKPESADSYWLQDSPLRFGRIQKSVLEDLNGDGRTDLVLDHPDKTGVFLAPPSGQPQWDDAPFWSLPNLEDFVVMDLDPAVPGKEVVYAWRQGGQAVGEEAAPIVISAFYFGSGDNRPLYSINDASFELSSLEAGTGLDATKPAVAVRGRTIGNEQTTFQSILLRSADDGTLQEMLEYPAPVAIDDKVEFLNDDHISGCVPVLGNDTNVLGGFVEITSMPQKGTASVDHERGGCIDYQWAGEETGADELRYKILGPQGSSSEARLRINIQGDPLVTPVAHADEVELDYRLGSSICVPVTDNDESAEFAQIMTDSTPSYGRVALVNQEGGGQCIWYQRTEPGSDTVSVPYSLKRGDLRSNEVELTIHLKNAPAAPQARPDTVSWPYGQEQPPCVPILANDDVYGAPIVTSSWPEGTENMPGYSLVQRMAGDSSDLCIQFVPRSPVEGELNLEYTVHTVGGASTTGLRIARTGEKPALSRAEPDTYQVVSGERIQMCLLENDVVNGFVEVINTDPEQGKVKNHYADPDCLEFEAPKVTENTETSFEYSLSNAAGLSNTVTVKILITAKPPWSQEPLFAANDRVIMNYQGNLQGCIGVLDNDNIGTDRLPLPAHGIDVQIVNAPEVGVAWVDRSGCINYWRLPSEVGDTSLTYKITTAYGGESEESTVRITMTGEAPGETL